MITMTLADVATAVGGRLTGGADPDATITGTVEYDSRKVGPGGLFVAIAGDRVDGHDFAPAAIADGAVAVLATREVDAPAIVVDDVLVGLGRLARAVVDRLDDLTVIGITGSSGKTSTKDVIARLCRVAGPTVATAGNFNNELGHPYTVCQATTDTRYLVLEMGARGLGHLSYLCEIAPVDVAVVLNVGTAHLEGFGSPEAIATAKSELPASLTAEGTAILNADDRAVAAMSEVTKGRVSYFGTGADADRTVHIDVSADHVTGVGDGTYSYWLHAGGATAQVELRLHGAHQVSNTLAAAAVAHHIGLSVDDIARELSSPLAVSPRRMDVSTRVDGVTLIDDSYNANPSSMAAALRALADVGEGRRTIAVLGYMAELGEIEKSAHEEIGRLAGRLGVEVVIVVGPEAQAIAVGARASGAETIEVEDQDAAIAVLATRLHPLDVVLVKASRYRTWDVADYLRDTPVSTEEART